MKTAVSLPTELFDRAEQEAARRGVSRSALYAEALARFMSEVAPDPVTEKLNRIYGSHEQSADLGASAAQRWIEDGSWAW